MKRIFSTLFFICVVLIPILGLSQNSPPEIIVTGNQNYCSDAPMPIVTSVGITDPDVTDTTLNQVNIQISEGYALGADTLMLTGIHPNIVWTFVIGEGRLILEGPATFAEFEAAISSVVFTTSLTVFNSNRSFSINLGDANFLPSTGHYYFYVAQRGISWPVARSAAASQTYFGLQGYLATLTTLEEAQLAGEQSPGTGWIGATDEANEGTWLWVTGPEAGTPFWQGGVTGTPVNGEFSFWNSGEPNNLGNEDYAHITSPAIGNPGSWNDLVPAGNPNPNNPFHPQGYLVEFGGLPGEPDINLSAASTIIMPQIEMVNVQGCEGEEFNLSITTNADEVSWYQDSALTNVVNTGTSYDVTLTETTTFFITSAFTGCTDIQFSNLTVTVDAFPEAIDITIQQCDDASADGISIFELNNFNGLIANGNITNVVEYFEDNQLTIPVNAINYNNTVNNQIIFARVLNQSTGCFAIAEVTLTVSLPVNNSFELGSCDDEVEDGLTAFNLSELNDTVLAGLPTTAQTTFFPTFDDALLNDNVLPNSYTNSTPESEVIFVKVTDGTECLGIFEVTLIVLPLPELESDETIFYCLNSFPATIILDGGIVNDIPNNFFYNWSTGETTIEIEINEPGTYSVDVMEVNGCTNRRTVIVQASNTATINNIIVEEASENNSITVEVSGEGDYQFSLDFENGPYQDSNIFENVQSGIRTIYIRDKNGCGVVFESFPVIGFPKFFTPNGDGQNDFWTIDGFDEAFLQNSKVQIFNRHGKVLTVLSASNPFWDGRYNGRLMPTDDYWFSVTLQDGRSFSKHFTLKR